MKILRVHTTELRLFENTIRAGTLISTLCTRLDTVQLFKTHLTMKTLSFYSLRNFKCIFKAKNETLNAF